MGLTAFTLSKPQARGQACITRVRTKVLVKAPVHLHLLMPLSKITLTNVDEEFRWHMQMRLAQPLVPNTKRISCAQVAQQTYAVTQCFDISSGINLVCVLAFFFSSSCCHSCFSLGKTQNPSQTSNPGKGGTSNVGIMQIGHGTKTTTERIGGVADSELHQCTAGADALR